MLNEKNFVTQDKTVQVAPAETLEQLVNILNLEDCSKININYKLNKVTAGCSCLNRKFGAKANNVKDALRILQLKVTYYKLTSEFSTINPVQS